MWKTALPIRMLKLMGIKQNRLRNKPFDYRLKSCPTRRGWQENPGEIASDCLREKTPKGFKRLALNVILTQVSEYSTHGFKYPGLEQYN